MTDSNDEYGGLGCLFVVSLCMGLWPAWESAKRTGRVDWFIAVGAFILYPALGALAVRLSEALWVWAHDSPKSTWTRDSRAYIGSFWPITLPFYILASLFVAFTSKFFE